MIASGLNLVMTVIGFAMSTMFIVFVCTRLICARIQLSASRRRAFPAASRSYHFSILDRRFNGLEPVVIANFPTKSFKDKFFSVGEDIQCPICLAEYQGSDILRLLPYCGHAFHITCIDIWLQQHSTCPVCRISLRVSPEQKNMMNLQYSQSIRSPRSPQLLNSGTFSQLLCTEHGFSTRILEDRRLELIPEDHPEVSLGGETVSSAAIEACVANYKDRACLQGAEHTQVEILSNH